MIHRSARNLDTGIDGWAGANYLGRFQPDQREDLIPFQRHLKISKTFIRRENSQGDNHPFFQ